VVGIAHHVLLLPRRLAFGNKLKALDLDDEAVRPAVGICTVLLHAQSRLVDADVSHLILHVDGLPLPERELVLQLQVVIVRGR